MQGDHWRIRNESQRANFVRAVMDAKFPFSGKIEAAERSLDQNALSFVWYGQLAKQLKEYDTEGWRRFCKLRFGIAIMRASSEIFRERWDRLIKDRFSYEEKLELMHDFPVTSLMDADQMREYLTAMQAYFVEKHGIVLTGLDLGYTALAQGLAKGLRA